MRKFRDAIDRRYVKIAGYAIVSALIILASGLALYHSGIFWAQLWDVITAIMTPLMLGLLFSYLLSPVVSLIERHLPQGRKPQTSHNLAVAITMLSLAAVFLLMTYLAINTLVQQIDRIRFEDFGALFQQLTGGYQEFFSMIAAQLDKMGFSVDTLFDRVTAILQGTPEMLTTALFSVIFTVYFLIDGKNIFAYWKRVFRVMLSPRAQETCHTLVRDAQHVFSGYLRGQFVDAVVVGVTLSILLTIAGVPYGAIIGVLTGVGNLIPYVTGFVGYGSLIIACLASADMHSLVVGAICIAIVLVIDSNVINPRLLGSAIKVHPLLVIVSLIAGGVIGGVLGMLVAVPVGAFIKLQFDRYLQRRVEQLAEESGAEQEAAASAEPAPAAKSEQE